MQFVVELLYWLVVECIFWGLGAAVKKLLGIPRSSSGIPEEWIGVFAILVLFTLLYVAFL